MQLEIILSSADPADYDAQDLGFLLHKHPARVHVRATAQGVARVFFPELSPELPHVIKMSHLNVAPDRVKRHDAPAQPTSPGGHKFHTSELKIAHLRVLAGFFSCRAKADWMPRLLSTLLFGAD